MTTAARAGTIRLGADLGRGFFEIYLLVGYLLIGDGSHRRETDHHCPRRQRFAQLFEAGDGSVEVVELEQLEPHRPLVAIQR